jgi:cytochrome c peroxidase
MNQGLLLNSSQNQSNRLVNRIRWLRAPRAWALAVVCAMGCGDGNLTESESSTLRSMAFPLSGGPALASPTNRYAYDADAAALGRMMFFDPSMSNDGQVACASCHRADEGWSDDRAVSEGAFGRTGGRHSMPIRTARYQSWWFWDGRADSMWSQAIAAMESVPEMDFSRAEAAHYVAAVYPAQYEAVFGALPDLTAVPPRGKPGDPAWDALDGQTRAGVERVFANVGKALEAYERQLDCSNTRFDQWARGDADMSQQEERGAAEFVREGCADCHSGSAFSDGEFHNIGIGSNGPGPDRGREQGIEALRASVFNGAGPYSDDPGYGAARIAEAGSENRTLGSFRTPSLRGVAQRGRFGHRGDRGSLRDFLDVYDRVRSQASAVGPLDPLVAGMRLRREADVAAFLTMLNCPDVPTNLSDPGFSSVVLASSSQADAPSAPSNDGVPSRSGSGNGKHPKPH